MSELLVQPSSPSADGTILTVTPESAGWPYVGFEVIALRPEGQGPSFPPHKHDRDRPPAETLLEETCHHRFNPPHGFARQRVYTEERGLDESLTFGDRDCVLVPRGYHRLSVPPGYELYYLNVTAGPTRAWAVANDPDHEWTLVPQEQP